MSRNAISVLINKLIQDIQESKARENFTKESQKNLDEIARNLEARSDAARASAAESRAAARNLDSRTRTEDAIRDYQVALKSFEGEKISADTAFARKLASKVDKEIEAIGKQMHLTDEQIKDAKNARTRAWLSFGVSTLKDISQEARAWILPFTDFHKSSKSTNNFYSTYSR